MLNIMSKKCQIRRPVGIYEEPESPNEAACYDEPESPNEGACLMYMMNRDRQVRAHV